jgi:hypothetical protein
MHATDSAGNPQPMTQRESYAINLHIDELVLHNFAPSDPHAIAMALERELTQLFSAEGVPPDLTEIDGTSRLDGGSFNVQRGAAPDDVGAHLARAVYHNLAGLNSRRQASRGSDR